MNALRTVFAVVLTLALGAGIVATSGRAVADDDNSPKKAVGDDADYKAGKKAIDAKNWKSAVDSFSRATRTFNDPDVYNLLAYSQRQSGDLDSAFKNYNTALRLDPNHRGAHEYIGEAYLMKSDLANAEKHLQALDRLCHKTCDEYQDLAKAIATFKTTGKVSSSW
jgi:Flp pilus assembly protein TadD